MSDSAFEFSFRCRQIPTVPVLECIFPFYNLQKPCNLRRDLACNILSIYTGFKDLVTEHFRRKMLVWKLIHTIFGLGSILEHLVEVPQTMPI
jgi:hypothetical protein